MTILRALLFAAFASAIAGSFAALALALARSESLHAARAAARDALTAAPMLVQATVAARIAGGANPLASIPPIERCTAIGTTPCALHATTSVALQAGSSASILQNNALIGEARIVVAMRSVVTDEAGRLSTIATRTAFLRTFAEPPFATYEGDGESGGLAPGLASGTLVDVLYRDIQSGASISGNVWSTPQSAPSSAPAPWPQ
ncbi:MAG: hypothetical protein ACP5O6_01270 [Candidatus Baltobacteraceae bacterium]